MDDVKGPDNPEYFERLVSEYQGQLRRLCCGRWIPKRRRASGWTELNTFRQSKNAGNGGQGSGPAPFFSVYGHWYPGCDMIRVCKRCGLTNTDERKPALLPDMEVLFQQRGK